MPCSVFRPLLTSYGLVEAGGKAKITELDRFAIFRKHDVARFEVLVVDLLIV